MSDFISRLAARAVRQETVAKPRLDLLFAEPETDVADVNAARHVVETEERTTRIVRSDVRLETLPAAERRVPGAPAERRLLRAARPDRAHGSPISAEARPTAESLSPPAARGRTRAQPTTPALATRTVQASAVAAAPRTADPLPPPPSTTPEESAPPVRVHIGRLEIRANVQEPPPQPVRRERRPVEELSLGDYLRRSR